MPMFLLIGNSSEACRGLNFISTKTRILSNLCHVCIQASHIEPCCNKCDMCFIRAKSWPLMDQKTSGIRIIKLRLEGLLRSIRLVGINSCNYSLPSYTRNLLPSYTRHLLTLAISCFFIKPETSF